MSLSDVYVIDSVKIDVTPSGGGATSRAYVAEDVSVQLVEDDEAWRTSDGNRHYFTNFQHLLFTISGEEIDQVTNTGDLRSPILINEDLKDTSGFTVEIYPDPDQAKKFEVIAFNPTSRLLNVKFASRSDDSMIRAITKAAVTRSDIEWFKKYG